MVKGIQRLHYGDTTLPESSILPGGDPARSIPIIFSVFLVQTEGRNIRVDAGCETMPGFEMHNFTTPMAVLQQYGVAAEDITDVIITHAHHDHIECVKYFADAVIHIQEDEYRDGREYLKHNTRICPFSESVEVDEGVTVVKIDGHSVGSCVVECELQGKTYVLCGDECYSFCNLKQKIPTASSVSTENSWRFIEQYTQPQYTCLLCHDTE